MFYAWLKYSTIIKLDVAENWAIEQHHVIGFIYKSLKKIWYPLTICIREAICVNCTGYLPDYGNELLSLGYVRTKFIECLIYEHSQRWNPGSMEYREGNANGNGAQNKNEDLNLEPISRTMTVPRAEKPDKIDVDLASKCQVNMKNSWTSVRIRWCNKWVSLGIVSIFVIHFFKEPNVFGLNMWFS